MTGFYLLILPLLASIASAQSVSDLPSCSLSCFATAVAATGCSNTDYTCQCASSNAATIRSSVTSCLASSTCSITDLDEIQSFSNTFCPSVLASASTASATKTGPTPSSSPSPSPSPSHSSTSSATSSTSSRDAAPSSALTSASSTSTSHINAQWGAGTGGTAWGALPTLPSNANRGPAFEAVSIILLSVAAMVLAFRFFARFHTKTTRRVIRGIGPDEWFAIFALIATAGVTADIIVGTKHGMGKHLSVEVTGPEITVILKLVYAFVILITLCFGLLKISILCLYLRMTPERSHHIIIYIVMGLTTAETLSAFIGAIFQCTPIHSYWSLGDPLQSPHCINILAFDVFNSTASVVEDIIIWILPIPVVWNLNVPFARKSGLYTLIAISFISVACAIARMTSLIVWMRSADISWNFFLIPFLSNIEACVAIITSSVPAIWPLFRRPEEKAKWSQPPVPMKVEPVQEWESQDSQDDTAVRSNMDRSDRSSGRWSFLSRKDSTKLKVPGQKDSRHLSTVQSEGMRTELKSMFEDNEEVDVMPGLAK